MRRRNKIRSCLAENSFLYIVRLCNRSSVALLYSTGAYFVFDACEGSTAGQRCSMLTMYAHWGVQGDVIPNDVAARVFVHMTVQLRVQLRRMGLWSRRNVSIMEKYFLILPKSDRNHGSELCMYQVIVLSLSRCFQGLGRLPHK